MGRHDRDPEPFTERMTGPFRRIRLERDTAPIPSAERKRRAWPVALIASGALAAAVGLPLGAVMAGGTEPSDRPPVATTDPHSPAPSPASASTPPEDEPDLVRPMPTVTVTRKRIEYTATPGPTVTITAPGSVRTVTPPAATATVRVTITPEPEVTVTETIINDRCFRVRDGYVTQQIECP